MPPANHLLSTASRVYDNTGGNVADSYETQGAWDLENHPFSRMYRQEEELFAEHIIGGAYADAIELGVGRGRFTSLLCGTARNVLGIDTSDQMLEAAREKLAREGHNNFRLMKADATAFDFSAEGPWDLAIAVQILEHARRPFELLGRVCGGLRGGGALFLSFGNALSPRELKYRFTRFPKAGGPANMIKSLMYDRDYYLGDRGFAKETEKQIRRSLVSSGMKITGSWGLSESGRVSAAGPAKTLSYLIVCKAVKE